MLATLAEPVDDVFLSAQQRPMAPLKRSKTRVDDPLPKHQMAGRHWEMG
jgi:hypothetical protein